MKGIPENRDKFCLGLAPNRASLSGDDKSGRLTGAEKYNRSTAKGNY